MGKTLYRAVWLGDPRTKKNSPRIAGKKVLPSKAYTEYEEACLWQIRQRPRIETRCNVKAVYYMKTHRVVDLPNLENATLDILVRGGVLADDRCTIAYTMDGSYVDYDRENPRVEITIEEV